MTSEKLSVRAERKGRSDKWHKKEGVGGDIQGVAPVKFMKDTDNWSE